MVTSDYLFELIKSLSSREKACFRKFSQLHVMGDSNNYVKLFDFISRMKTYDERALLQHFKNEKFINQLSVAKNYLYSVILRSLRSFKRPVRKVDVLKVMIEDVNVLFERRLFLQAKKLLKRARKIAIGYELHSQLLQLLVFETKIAIAEKAYDKKNDKLMKSNYLEREKVIAALSNAFEIDLLEYKITSLISRHEDSVDKAYLKSLEKILVHEVLNDENDCKSLTARLKFNNIFAAFHYTAGNPEESYKYLNREIEILSAKQELLEDRLADYFILLSNRLLLSADLNDPAGFSTNLAHLKSELSSRGTILNERTRLQAACACSVIEMSFRNKSGEFNRSIEVYQELQKKTGEFTVPLSVNDNFNVNEHVSKAYFGLGNFSVALEYINKILNDPHSADRYANLSLARIFALIIHYELGNIELLEHLIRAAHRQEIIKGRLLRFERIIFRFLQKLPDAVTAREMKEKFEQLNFQLKKYENDNSVKNAMKFFDFFSWLNSKITGKKFGDVVKISINRNNPQ